MPENLLAEIIISAFISFVVLFSISVARGVSLTELRRSGMDVGLAKARGHVVTAHLVDTRSRAPKTSKGYVERTVLGIYEYEYRGKLYRYEYSSTQPPYALTLYFVSNPRNARAKTDLRLVSGRWGVRYLVIFAIVFALAYAVVHSQI